MHTFLIIGGTKENRVNKITSLLANDHIHTFDVRPLICTEDTNSIGITAVRNWQKQLQLMPSSSPLAAGTIESADLLTTEAQNALLKTLEEPPMHTHIYMEAQSDNALLPTILSRCTTIKIHTVENKLTPKEETVLETWKHLLTEKVSIGSMLATLDTTCKNKIDAQDWVEHSIIAIHKTKNVWSTQMYLSIEKQLLTAKKQLASNVSYKLVLDGIFFSFETRQS
ncbi:MAG: hypothetical protein WAV51_01525 [Microgenomates group bacterium]